MYYVRERRRSYETSPPKTSTKYWLKTNLQLREKSPGIVECVVVGKNDGLKTKLFRKRRLAGLPTIQSLKTKFFVLPVHFLLRLMPGIILNYLQSLVFRTGKKFGIKDKGGLKHHCEQDTHRTSFLKTMNFMKIMASNTSEVPIAMNTERKKKIEKNNAILDANIDIMKCIASQGLASRGHDEMFDPEEPHKNRGNYVALQELVGKFNPVMQEAVDKTKASHAAKTRIQASMMSKQVFEELIEITGKKVSTSVFEDVKKSGMYVIISDEVTVFNQSYMSICLRYVHHTEKKVHEDFVSYEHLESGKAEAIFNTLVEELEEVGGLNLGKIRSVEIKL